MMSGCVPYSHTPIYGCIWYNVCMSYSLSLSAHNALNLSNKYLLVYLLSTLSALTNINAIASCLQLMQRPRLLYIASLSAVITLCRIPCICSIILAQMMAQNSQLCLPTIPCQNGHGCVLARGLLYSC